MNGAYVQAAHPEPYTVLGLRLLPLSIGRYRLLERLASPFVVGGQTATEDLILGVLICSMPVREFWGFINGPDFDAECARWGEFLRVEMAKDCHFELVTRFGLFRSYIREGSKTPDFWSEREDESSTGHWLQNLEVCLRSELGWSNEEIEEAPLTKALADALRYAEGQGSVRLIESEELAHADDNAARFGALLRGGSCPASN